MNDQGEILGTVRVPNPEGSSPSWWTEPVLWNAGFEAVEFPAEFFNAHPDAPEYYPAWQESDEFIVYDIDNSGRILGTVRDHVYGVGGSHEVRSSAVVLEDGAFTTLPHHMPKYAIASSPGRMNNLGQVTGGAQIPTPEGPLTIEWTTTVWDVDQSGEVQPVPIGIPDDGIFARGVDINDLGELIVNSNPGWYLGPPYNQSSAWLWTGSWTRLGSLGDPALGQVTRPRGLNNRGEVVGISFDSMGAGHGVAWRLIFSPSAHVHALLVQLHGLAQNHVLNAGNVNALVSVLEGALADLEGGNTTPARNKLRAFINKVRALVRSGRLDDWSGQLLLEAADRAIIALGG